MIKNKSIIQIPVLKVQLDKLLDNLGPAFIMRGWIG